MLSKKYVCGNKTGIFPCHRTSVRNNHGDGRDKEREREREKEGRKEGGREGERKQERKGGRKEKLTYMSDT